jgi:ribosomal protein S18 acetylase RimI-like enzyme
MSPPDTGVRSRPATQDDLTILWDFLAIAAYEPDVHAAKAVPFVAFHLAGWQRSEDFGFIAERDGTAIGAAWARQFARDEQPAFFVDGRTPEITVGVKPHIRGRGVGRMLLHALIGEAARRGIGLCLNVRHDNPARRLYERVGFRLVRGSGVPNRVGGTSFGMLWAAPRSADAAPHPLAISCRSRESGNPVSDKAAAVPPCSSQGQAPGPRFRGGNDNPL